MTYLPAKSPPWKDENNPLGPPSNPAQASPVSAAAMSDLEARIEAGLAAAVSAAAGVLPPQAFIFNASQNNWPIPAGAKVLEITMVAGGGSGGGGGSSGGIPNQVGGSGATAGGYEIAVIPVGALRTLNIGVGAGGAGGALGGAPGGNAGVQGNSGVQSTVTGVGLNLSTSGGGRGLNGLANSAVTVNGITWQSGSGATGTTSTPGSGGYATSAYGFAGGNAQGPLGAGGQGGAPCSATNGGEGGKAPGFGTATSILPGTAPDVNGTNGADAPPNTGAGGGGGGGGAVGGAGGNGGAGGSGYVVIRVYG